MQLLLNSFPLLTYTTIFIGVKGRTKRAARDIRDAVEGEKLRRSGEKLERIKGDLETLTRENKMLRR